MIIWGRASGRSKIGYVADFCPFCRDVTQLRVTRLYSYLHVYFVRIGRRRTQGHEASCEGCQMAWTVDVGEYAIVSVRKRDSLLECIAETNPRLADHPTPRMCLEERVRANAITADEREALIREPFRILAPALENRYGASTPIDAQTWQIFLVSTLGSLGVMLIGAQLAWDWLVMLGLVVLFIGLPLSLISFANTHRRYLRRYVYPALAQCLVPLVPSESDIEQVLKALQRAQLIAGRKIKAWRVYQAIQESALVNDACPATHIVHAEPSTIRRVLPPQPSVERRPTTRSPLRR